MFITLARHNREKQELLGACNRLAEAVLKNTEQGLFLLDGKDRILSPVSHSLSTLFRRADIANLTFERLLAPLVSAKTLKTVRTHIAALMSGAPGESETAHSLADIELRFTNADGSFDAAHYSFEFDPVFVPNAPRAWLVRVTDITARVQATRELEDLRGQCQIQKDVLGSVLQLGRVRFARYLQNTDTSLKTIATVLKKPARAEDAFRLKLDEILDEVDDIRREAGSCELRAMENSARVFEDALHDLRNRSMLSGGDFLPLSVKLDQLYTQFATIKSLAVAAGSIRDGRSAATTAAVPGASPAAAAGSLDNALQALTEQAAEEYHKRIRLECSGLNLVPAAFHSLVKNVAIQLIRNAVMHGIETPMERKAAGKPERGNLRLEFRARERHFELLFEDDGCGLVPEQVRATALARGVITEEIAARMRDREAIKLIFKSRYTTRSNGAEVSTHGAGMSLVRRYVHEAGGKIALASLPGHETRFKITLPWPASEPGAPPAAGARVA